jgi:hypothetical protein
VHLGKISLATNAATRAAMLGMIGGAVAAVTLIETVARACL